MHYSFMECGGGNVAHFDFEPPTAVAELSAKITAARICSRSLVVLDGDNRTKPRFAEIEKDLGNDLVVLEGKEVEHLLPLEVLSAYVARRVKGIDTSVLKLDDYHREATPLGKILDAKLGQTCFSDKQTIKNKDGLCTFATQFMRDNPAAWKLTPGARAICERIVAFVKNANGLPA